MGLYAPRFPSQVCIFLPRHLPVLVPRMRLRYFVRRGSGQTPCTSFEYVRTCCLRSVIQFAWRQTVLGGITLYLGTRLADGCAVHTAVRDKWTTQEGNPTIHSPSSYVFIPFCIDCYCIFAQFILYHMVACSLLLYTALIPMLHIWQSFLASLCSNNHPFSGSANSFLGFCIWPNALHSSYTSCTVLPHMYRMLKINLTSRAAYINCYSVRIYH